MISLRKGCSALGVAAVLLTSACGDTETTTAPLTPAKLVVVGSSAVTAPEGFTVPELIKVRLLTTHNLPVSRRVVHFTVTTGGELSSDSSFTDENGEAAVGVKLGSAGVYTVTATSDGVAPVTITATARAPIPSGFFYANGNGQTGFRSDTVAPLSVFVLDQSGVPAVGVPVTFTVTSGGGIVTSTVPTDYTGTASATYILGAAGTQTVSATYPGFTPVTFTATFIADACTSARQKGIPFATVRTIDTVDCQLLTGQYIEYFDIPVSGAFSISDTSTAFVPFLSIRSGVDTIASATAGTTGTTFKAFLVAGTYRVGASTTLPNATGLYKLRTASSPSTVTGCEPAYIMKGANSGTQAIAATDCQLTFNDGNGFGSQLHYGDQYFIYLTAAQAISIVQSGATDHFIRVLNPAGTVVATRDNAGTGGAETLAFTATVAGRYAIQASAFNNAANGTPPDVGGYTLTVN